MSKIENTPQLWFITGTDTDAGKTWVTAALLRRLRADGVRAAAVKPLASGCPEGDPAANADIRLLHRCQPERRLQNLFLHAFEPAIAPHIAARQAGVEVRAEALAGWCLRQAEGLDVLLVEGVGGWCVPLNEDEMLADWARAMRARVLLVVGMKLGCINHALLSARVIQADGLSLLGWLANWPDPHMQVQAENLHTLQRRMPVPLLGQLPWGRTAEETALMGWSVNRI